VANAGDGNYPMACSREMAVRGGGKLKLNVAERCRPGARPLIKSVVFPGQTATHTATASASVSSRPPARLDHVKTEMLICSTHLLLTFTSLYASSAYPADGPEALCFRVVRLCVRACGRSDPFSERLAVHF